MSETTKPIASAPGYFITADGRVLSSKQGVQRELRLYTDRKGYFRITLWVGGHHLTRLVHQLVAETFLGPRPSEAHEVRHLDGNPQNNQAENLAWGTRSENNQDTVRHGRHGAWLHPESWQRGDKHWTRRTPDRVKRGDESWSRRHPERLARGERVGGAKLTADRVQQIRAALGAGRKHREIANEFGVSRPTVTAIASGRNWKHLPTQMEESR